MNPTDPPYLSVILACYNEAPHLEQSVCEILATLGQVPWSYEIIFVDDCSRDGTPDILRRLVASHPDLPLRLILHEQNRGRGATVSDGFLAARGEIAGYLDIDLEVHCRYIPSLVRAIESGADIATVRRIYAFQLRSLDRYFLSRGYSWLVRRLLRLPFHDTETGYKFFRSRPVLPVVRDVQDSHWFWDTEFMTRAADRGLRVAEIPGAYVRREDKRSTVRGLRDSWRYFWRLLEFRRSGRQPLAASGPRS